MATIGKVTITSPVRTTIADPRFQPKPNVALSELTDVLITTPQEGQVVAYDGISGKFKTSTLASITLGNIDGGKF
jgi:hypothetical protein